MTSPTTNNSQGLYYGWIIAVSAGFILLVTNGMTLGGLNVFDKPLLAALAEATGEPVRLDAFKLRDAVTLFVSGLMAPFAGAAADRFGVRPLMVVGALLLAAGYFLYPRVASLADIYLIHVLFAGALAGCGLVVNVILVSRWFVRNRGMALGIALAGTSLGNGTLPPVNAALMANVGWQAAFLWTSLLPLLLLPVILFVVRERPASLEREMPPGVALRPAAALEGMTLPEALRTANFWILALIAMFTFFSIIGTQAHLNLYMLGRGFSQMDAGFGYTVLFFLGLLGKLASGFLADRFGRKPVFVGTLALMLAGALALLVPGGGLLWGGLTLFGLGWGGLYTLLQLLAADYFGPPHLGKIIGAITVLDTFGGGFGPAVIGALRESSGDYSSAFLLVAGLIAAALVLATRFRPDRRPAAA
jgi:MFS family permease